VLMAGLFHHICLLKRIKFMQLVGKLRIRRQKPKAFAFFFSLK